MTKKSHIEEIFLVTDHVINSTSSKEIIKKKLLLKEQYLAQRAKSAYIVSIYQL